MVRLNDIKLKPRLITLFLLVGIIPLALVGWWSSRMAGNALMHQSANQLESARGIKKTQIESFFDERRGDMGVLVETVGTLRNEASQKLTAVRQVKRAAVEGYFRTINDQIVTFSQNRMIVDAMRECRGSGGDVLHQRRAGPPGGAASGNHRFLSYRQLR